MESEHVLSSDGVQYHNGLYARILSQEHKHDHNEEPVRVVDQLLHRTFVSLLKTFKEMSMLLHCHKNFVFFSKKLLLHDYMESNQAHNKEHQNESDSCLQDITYTAQKLFFYFVLVNLHLLKLKCD